jgi:heptosyltransferase-3
VPIHVLVIRRRYLGDLVLLGAFLRNLRLHWPAGRIAVLAESAYAGVLALNPDVDTVLTMPRGAAAWPGFALNLWRQGFTHVFNLDNTEGTALLSRASGAGFRLGLHHGGYRLKLRGCYTHAVNDPDELHESRPITEYYLTALAAAGVPLASREVRLVPRPADLEKWGRYVGGGGRVLLVHPGSRSPWRLWPAERFASICDRAQDELGAQVVLVGGPNDQAAVEAIRRLAKSHLLTLQEPMSIPRFAALARLSALMLCHDSGPMHVAAAVGTPVVALYGSQNAVLFRPAGDRHILVQPPLPCTDCVAPDRCVPSDSYRNLCVRRNAVETVFAAVQEQWKRL